MKAVLCKQYGPPDTLVIEDVESPVPGPGEVVVSMHAASVNFPDVLIIQNKYQIKPPLPFSPGSELSGIVKAIGDGVTRVKPGDRVIAFTGYGAFAEEVKTQESRLVPMPEGMDFPTGASFILTYGTSDHALRDRGELKAGETLLVLGAAGGVGLAAVEIGKALGARVVACASTEDKLAACRTHGADETINYSTEDLRERIKTITEGRGVDVVYDAVGGAYTEPALRSTAWRGRLLVVGFAAGDIPKLALNLALLKERSIVGVYWGDWTRRDPKGHARNMAELARWLADGTVRPAITERITLDQVPDALARMSRRELRGKVVVVP